jgi:amino acid transporter
MADFTAPAASRRSVWGTAAVALTALSILGFLLLAVGDAANWRGFSEEDESTTAGDASWICFSLGAILALITGLIAFLRGRRRNRPADTRAGQIGIAWFVVAVILTAIFASLA